MVRFDNAEESAAAASILTLFHTKKPKMAKPKTKMAKPR